MSLLKRPATSGSQPSAVNGSLGGGGGENIGGTYSRTEGNDEFSTEESPSEPEVRVLLPNQTHYRLLNGDVIAR